MFVEHGGVINTQLRVKQVLLGIGGKMGHYDKQREKHIISHADYEHYVDGALQSDLQAREEMLSSGCDSLYSYMEPEFLDFLEVLKMGAKKHGNSNWLNADGKKSSHKDMHDSMFHHIAKSYAGIRLDQESGLDELLHVASRALMCYTLIKRGIKHKEDL